MKHLTLQYKMQRGRKKITDKKKAITIYEKESIINSLGGLDKTKTFLIKKLQSHGTINNSNARPSLS